MLGSLKEIFKAKPTGPALGARIDLEKRYLLADKTSQGSMSKVYRALDIATGKTICVKVQLRDKNEAAAERCSKDKPNEGEIGYLIRHPNVVATYDWGYTYHDEIFVAMEYIDGVSLEYVENSINLGTRGKMKVLAQAAEGLAAIHAAGFLHHDINPRNILINKENRVKLIDFGLSVPDTAKFHKPGNRTGALAYMAPELLRREATDCRIDVYSFGAVAYEFLTGRPVYDAPNGNTMASMLQRINTDPVDPSVANPKLSDELCAVLRKSISRHKEDRFSTMAEFARALATVPPKRSKSDPETLDPPHIA